MPKTTITNFDPARIPDTEEEASFHSDATYVFSHLSAEIIPKFNQNLDWIDAALAGDSQTILDSLTALGADVQANETAISGKLSATGKAVDSDKLDGQHASYFATAGHTHSHAAFNPTQIPGGHNLNNYQSPGFYWQPANANAVSGSNYPVDLAGSLIVSKGAGVGQIYLTYNNGNQRMFFRGFYSGSWSAWREVTVEDKIRNSWAGIRSENSNGYIDLGPANDSCAHIYTDRPYFYFNKQLQVNGSTVWNTGNDGSGSGLDADKVDGLQASSFLRSDANDTASGTITLTGVLDARRSASSEKIRVNYGGSTSHSPYIGFYRGTTREGYLQFQDTVVVLNRDGGGQLTLYGSGDARINDNRIHHSGLGAGAIGTYMFANNKSGGTVSFGQTVAGSSLRPTSAGNPSQTGYTPSGTWRCMGYKTGGNTSFSGTYESTLWLRIA